VFQSGAGGFGKARLKLLHTPDSEQFWNGVLPDDKSTLNQLRRHHRYWDARIRRVEIKALAP
jgi:hypothetical protein